MREDTEGRTQEPGLWLAAKVQEAPTALSQATPRKWALVAGVLLLGLLLMPYLEAMVFLPGLASRVAATSRAISTEPARRQLTVAALASSTVKPAMRL